MPRGSPTNPLAGKPPRAWHKKHKKMYNNIETVWWNTKGKLHAIETSMGGYFYSTVIVLMWPTGLQDKNGTEIYEGDIIKVSGYGYEDIHMAKFDEKKNTYVLSECGGDNELYRSIKSSLREVEVIGNIHQHPGLLVLTRPDERGKHEGLTGQSQDKPGGEDED